MNLDLYQKQGTAKLPDFSINENLNNPVLYTLSDALKNAVNVALVRRYDKISGWWY